MAEMIDREKILEKLREKSDGWRGTYTGDVYAYVQQMIKKAPVVDAVEVVRCKDCKWSAWRASPFGVMTIFAATEKGKKMRDIIFRGKRTDNGEWVEGSLLKVTIDGKNAHLIFGDNFCFVGNDVKAMSHALVDPDTVGQYTGLKDKNGKRIFEGDRVVYPDSTSYSSYDDYNEGNVDYDEEAMRFYFTDRWSVEMEDFEVVDGIMVDVQIIGNVHDAEMIGG